MTLTSSLDATAALRYCNGGVLTRAIGGTSLQVSPALTAPEREPRQNSDVYRDVPA